jgi:hypothetical protein
VPKIAEYEFDASDDSKRSYDGAFHIEGMPTENIVATAVYVLDRDDGLEGGEIEFKRQFTRNEQARYFGPYRFSELTRDLYAEDDKQFIPLGTLPTPQGRSFVFPNHVVHKVNKMGVQSGSSQGKVKRRIVAFFLIDPTARICSSSDVPPIVERGISFEEACAHRLRLMEERGVSKGVFNKGFGYQLCEH